MRLEGKWWRHGTEAQGRTSLDFLGLQQGLGTTPGGPSEWGGSAGGRVACSVSLSPLTGQGSVGGSPDTTAVAI